MSEKRLEEMTVLEALGMIMRDLTELRSRVAELELFRAAASFDPAEAEPAGVEEAVCLGGVGAPPARPPAAPAGDGWRPAASCKPIVGVWVLVSHRNFGAEWVTIGCADREGRWLDRYSEEILNVTHWRPLPPAPGQVGR